MSTARDTTSVEASFKSADNPPAEVSRARRPLWLILMLMGDFAFERAVALSTGTFLEVLANMGIGAHTTRSTLQRMCDRDLLIRHRHGREVYFGLSTRATALLQRGQTESWRPVNPTWNESWTLLSFSIPEHRRPVRYRLRSRLSAAGFGQLQSGLWIAPGKVDVAPLVADLDVLDDIKSFQGFPMPSTSVEDLIHEAYDMESLAGRYRGFLQRWSNDAAIAHSSELASLLVMQAEWQQIAQSDPRLPLRHLPGDWPVAAADRLFRERFATWKEPARQQLYATARVLDVDAT